jgi:Mg2+/Co2+ transporter CorB
MAVHNAPNAINLDDPLEDIIEQIKNSRHTRIPVYRKNIDKVFGVLHLRKSLIQITQGGLCKESLAKSLDRIYFVPENMPLHQLLINFKREELRFGLVIDEYGDVLGLVTLEDLLQEIVGEFTSTTLDIKKQKDGSYLVDASINLRELNRITGWAMPTEGPKTLNGLIIEYLETIPEPGVSLKLFDHRLEITRIDNNVIKEVRFYPKSE